MELRKVPVIHVNKHPIVLDHDTQVVLEASPGESLYSFLQRNIQDVDKMEVSVNGRIVDPMEWHRIVVTDGREIVVRTTLHRSALYIVAMVALLYFTGGASAAVMSGGAFGGVVTGGAIAGLSTAASMAAIGAVQIIGAMLINKVLGPKLPKPSSMDRDSVFNIGAARNSIRQREPAGLLFGSVRVTPDYAAKPFNYYRGNDQYIQMLLTPGINVGRYHDLYFGDTLLSNFDNQAVVKRSGFPQMSEDTLTSTTNVDVIAGAELDPNDPVTRTTPAGVNRIQIDLSYLLFDLTTKGKKKYNQETVVVRAKLTTATQYTTLGNISLRNQEQTEQRRSYYYDVAEGAYDVQVVRLGLDTDGSGATCKFTLVSVTAYQAEQNDFDGVGVIQIDIKGTGQLNGAPDEVRGIMDAAALELWNGTEWIIVDQPGYAGTSNPGAQALRYIRGFYSKRGELVAGMGAPDSMIDIEAFKALMVHCIENKIEYNMWIQEDRNHREFLDGILYPAFGRITMAPGRITPIWAREEQGIGGVVNMATIKKGDFQVNYTLVSAADGIELTYRDRTDWQAKTLRVPQPGISVDEMLNPATIGAEGVVDELQAATIARYHLAQTLYQAKDITYSTNMQFLSYNEMDLLELQHDLTQWGYGGRLVDIRNDSGVITLTVDDDVPGRDMANAWIGLVVPGEVSYRVFRVQPFTGTSDTLTLVDPWPSDMEFPVNDGTKAIHDTIWIYDFKQTPGKRVRVVGMTPDDEFNGASVSVVPEDANFWNFVKTGEYIPPSNDSLLDAKPIASNLSVSENVIEQGDTVYTELQALWSITNTSVRNVVTCAKQGEPEVVVAETIGLSASWRIAEEGIYTVTVRPYAESGAPGVATTVVYDTRNTNLPPVNVDALTIAEIGAGIRKYSWGFLATTIQSPDMAGVEIRYVAGNVPSPNWDQMTPIGDDGFHTVAFESAVPEAGVWTFAIRTRNTSGVLSPGLLVVSKTLTNSIVQNIDQITAAQVAQQQALDQEVADRIAADLNVATAAGADATAKANAARDEALARVDALAAEIGEIVNAPEWVATDEYIAGWLVRYDGGLYRAIVANVGVQPDTDPATWEYIGQFASVAEVAAAALQLATTTASELSAEALRIDSLQVRMPAGEGVLETKARVDQVNQASIDRDGALAQSITSVGVEAGEAKSTATSALTVANDAATIANAAQTTADGVSATATSALNTANNASSIANQVKYEQGEGRNLLNDPNFDAGVGQWTVGWNPGGMVGPTINTPASYSPPSCNAMVMYRPGAVAPNSAMGIYLSEIIQIDAVAKYIASSYFATDRATGAIGIHWLDANKAYISEVYSAAVTGVTRANATLADYTRAATGVITPPANARFAQLSSRMFSNAAGVDPVVRVVRPMLEIAKVGQTAPSNWSGSGKGLAIATQTLSVGIDAVSGRLAAKVTNALDVNGNISGTVSENDGVRSYYGILADVFRVISSGMTGFEIQGGYQRNYSAGAQLVMGHNFGSGDLIFWYGPNIGAAACSKANATIWFDKNGGAYFGGTLSAGVLKNAAQSTQVSGSAQVETGKFGTNGRPKVITYSLLYQNAFFTGTNIGGNQTLTARMVLERQIGTGGWVEVSSRDMTGERQYIGFEPGIGYNYSFLIGGSSTFTDNTNSLDNYNYRVRIVSAVNWPFTRPEGGPEPSGSQSLTVVSVES